MKNRLKTIFLVATLTMVSLFATAQTNPVDKVAQLDDVYAQYIPAFMIKGLANMGSMDILKATPIPTGMLRKLNSMQFIMTSKKKAVKKAQKILKDLDNPRNYSVLFRSSSNKDEKIVIYASPANSETFNEAILVINEHDRQVIVIQLLGEFSMEDVNDLEDEFNNDTPNQGKTSVTILDDDEAL
ncbi:MAG: DUF4252 domain-containing protein [Muribaculaceae bacterium]|nr:DUF4252 domain-containing protein [Muribaculaceae bacterium]